MAAVRTHYEILNVAPGAELVVIEAAYRALMKKYHPDQGGGAADGPGAADINLAYAVLRDPERRAEYDHKEWIRQRDISLAAYQPPPAPPRAPSFFGWGGWLVAAVLAGMIALMATRGAAPPLSEAEQARAAAMAAPDMRSQPLPPDKSLVTSAEAADIRADAYAGRAETPKPAPPPAPPVAPARTAELDVIPAPAPDHLAARPLPPRHRAAPHRRRALAGRHDKDFLERQGYIY
ncbi:MAG: J domain-containing protein [Alphaproteobacteria bacterium]|nr:J domain-containing protein [Alphaproteobacteria bacterium]